MVDGYDINYAVRFEPTPEGSVRAIATSLEDQPVSIGTILPRWQIRLFLEFAFQTADQSQADNRMEQLDLGYPVELLHPLDEENKHLMFLEKELVTYGWNQEDFLTKKPGDRRDVI